MSKKVVMFGTVTRLSIANSRQPDLYGIRIKKGARSALINSFIQAARWLT
jgi:hypothetical protein